LLGPIDTGSQFFLEPPYHLGPTDTKCQFFLGEIDTGS